jgi:mannose-1-phosphate guanylyltransferase
MPIGGFPPRIDWGSVSGSAMKAIVLIGGFGTRLRPVTYSVPKQLIPLAGKAMLYHVLDLVPPNIEEIVLATGYKSDVIEEYVRAHPFRIPLRSVVEAEPLGTGGGMKNAGEGMTDPFLLLNSDVIASLDLSAMLAAHQSHGGLGTMALAQVEDTRPYGVAALDADDRIVKFVEKPEPQDAPSHWINAGLAVWSRQVLDEVAPGVAISFESEIVPRLLERKVYGYRFSGFWDDAGTPERLLRSQRLLFDAGRGGRGTIPKGSHGSGPVAVGTGVNAAGASFGPYVTLDHDVTVEPGAHVENSIVMAGTTIEREAAVSGSLLGPKARVRAGHNLRGAVLGDSGEA